MASSAVPQDTLIVSVGPVTAEATCTVIRQSITHCCSLDHGHDPAVLTAWLANKTPEDLAVWISASSTAAWGAYRGDTMVGFALLARALLQHVEAHARKAGLAILDLESTRTAEHFYRCHGYVPHGAVQTWAGLQAQPMRKVF